jgi:hypothetical protein
MPTEHQSSIDRLPDDIRTRLQELLRDPHITQKAAREKINAILDETDHPERLSRSAVNRYYQKMQEAGAKLRQSREVAEMWIGKLGAAPQGKVGHLVNEILRTLSFDMALVLQEGKLDEKSAPAVVQMLKGLSLTMMRLEKAASENVKREEEIRKRALEEAADRVEEAATQMGQDKEQADFWRKKVLGMEAL